MAKRYKDDLTGKQFGAWTVLSFSHTDKIRAYWNCKCVCGKERRVNRHGLVGGTSQSCGCISLERRRKSLTRDLTGKKFNKLTAIRKVETDDSCVSWLWKCDCGTEKIIRGYSVTSGHTKTCGCIFKEKRKIRPGEKFGRFTVLSEVGKNNHGGIYYKCRCECGKEKRVRGNLLYKGIVVSCRCFAREQTSIRSKKIFGPNHPSWNPELTEEDRISRRLSWKDNKNWRDRVLKRDNYTCIICGHSQKRGMVAHHLDGYHWCKEKRFVDSNGVTLCRDCHEDFHLAYGCRENTKIQFNEWIEGKGLQEVSNECKSKAELGEASSAYL